MGLDDELHWSEVYDKLQECKKNLEVALEKRNYWFQQYLLFKDSAEAFAGRIAQLERDLRKATERIALDQQKIRELEEKIREKDVIIEDYEDCLPKPISKWEEEAIAENLAEQGFTQEDIDRMGSDNG